jgi:hypothetical protein
MSSIPHIAWGIAAQIAATLLAWLFCRWFFEKSA